MDSAKGLRPPAVSGAQGVRAMVAAGKVLEKPEGSTKSALGFMGLLDAIFRHFEVFSCPSHEFYWFVTLLTG